MWVRKGLGHKRLCLHACTHAHAHAHACSNHACMRAQVCATPKMYGGRGTKVGEGRAEEDGNVIGRAARAAKVDLDQICVRVRTPCALT